MADDKVPTIEEAFDTPSKPKRVNFINKNLIITLGGIFVGALALAILPGAIKEDRDRENAAPPVGEELAKASNLEAERTTSLASALSQQREQVEREEAARRKAEEEAKRLAAERRQSEDPSGAYVGVVTPTNDANLDAARRKAEEARLRHEESVRTSPLIAASGAGGSAFSAEGLKGKAVEEIGRRIGGTGSLGGAQEDLSQTAIKMLKARLEQPETGGALATPQLANDRNKAWADRYSAETGTKRPLLRDEPTDVPVVLQGAVIPAAIITEINSDLPGQITAQVTMDVYDSHSRYLLIPKGAKLVGSYNNDVTPGQERVMAAFRRLIRPDGTSIDLEGMIAADQTGQSGVKDQVDNHFWKMFGSSLMIAGVAWLTERNQPGTVMVGGGDATSPEKASGQILRDMSEQLLKRNTRIPPTLTIRRGHKFNVTVTRDIALPPIAVALR